MALFEFAKDLWLSLMDETKNSLRWLPLTTAHMLLQILAWMWSAIFSVAVGSYFVFGITAVGHSLIIAGLVITYLVFRQAETENDQAKIGAKAH